MVDIYIFIVFCIEVSVNKQSGPSPDNHYVSSACSVSEYKTAIWSGSALFA